MSGSGKPRYSPFAGVAFACFNRIRVHCQAGALDVSIGLSACPRIDSCCHAPAVSPGLRAIRKLARQTTTLPAFLSRNPLLTTKTPQAVPFCTVQDALRTGRFL